MSLRPTYLPTYRAYKTTISQSGKAISSPKYPNRPNKSPSLPGTFLPPKPLIRRSIDYDVTSKFRRLRYTYTIRQGRRTTEPSSSDGLLKKRWSPGEAPLTNYHRRVLPCQEGGFDAFHRNLAEKQAEVIIARALLQSDRMANGLP